MRIYQTAFLATTLAVAAAAVSVSAQDKPKTKDRAVTISGCVVAGEAPDSFILKDVKQVSEGWNVTPKDPSGAPAFFWLNTTEGLAARVGQRVEVAGTVDFSDSHKGQTKVTIDPDDTKDTKTEISSAGRSVKTKVDNPAIPKVAEGAEVTKVKTPSPMVYDLHVKTVRTVPGVCPAGK
jgi:hypothetical protein